jgi:hypothetical protein
VKRSRLSIIAAVAGLLVTLLWQTSSWADFPSVVPITGPFWAAHWLQKRPEGGYAYDVYVAISTDSGQSWSEGIMPHRDGTPTEHGFVSLFPWQGGAGVIWLDSAGSDGEIKVQLVDPDGHPGLIYHIARSEVSRPAGFPQLAVDGQSLIVAWTDTFGGETRVKSARIVISP